MKSILGTAHVQNVTLIQTDIAPSVYRSVRCVERVFVKAVASLNIQKKIIWSSVKSAK